MRKNSTKNIRINNIVRRELSDIIRNEVKDPRIDPFVSVTEVEVAPDLKTCKAYISVLSPGDAGEETIRGLKSAEGFIRTRLAHTVNLRNTPQIRFILDNSIEYGVMMTKKIEEIAATLPTEPEDEEIEEEFEEEFEEDEE